MADQKVTVIGFTGSGKTSYLAGMYNIMSYGLEGFTLSEADLSQDYYLQNMWENMIDPENRRWPAPSDQIMKYNFSLSYAFSEILEFEWLDYPGGLLTESAHSSKYEELKNQLKESSCLIIVINGESFYLNTQDKESYIKGVENNLKRKKDIEAIRKLAVISKENGALPPIAIIVTKSDLIPEDKIGYVEEIIKKNFNPLFIGDNAITREVSLILTTLGDDIQNGGELDAINIEQPIAYAVLNILAGYIKLAKAVRTTNEEALNTIQNSLGSFLHKSKIEEARKNIQQMESVIGKFSKDAICLMDRFPFDKKMYVNGISTNLHEHYRKKLGF